MGIIPPENIIMAIVKNSKNPVASVNQNEVYAILSLKVSEIKYPKTKIIKTRGK